MRKIDYWIGIPLCFIATIIYRFQRLLGLKNPHYKEAPKNVLFIELAEMGSTVLAYPAIKKLKSVYPNSNVYFLIFRHIKESMDIIDAVPKENVLTIDSSNAFSLFRDTLKFMLTAREKKIDTAINLEMFARYSTILSYLSGAGKTVGFHKYHQEGLYTGNFLTHKVMYNPHIHTSLSFISLIYALQHPNEIPLTKVPINNEKLEVPKLNSDKKLNEKVWNLLKSISPDISPGKKIVIVNPNASKLISIRKWPLESYAALIKKLVEDENIYVAITGLESEKQDAKYIFDFVKSGKVLDLAGRTTLRELIELFGIGSVFITNDSGPAHFASLTNTHIVVFFGPETPKLYKPLSNNCTVLYSGYACSPCVSAFNQRMTPCSNNLCLKSIGVENVYDTIRGILYKSKK